MLAWYFCRNDKKLSWGDGDRVRVGRTLRVGQTFKAWFSISWCGYGVYVSEKIMNALEDAQGEVICRVKLSDLIKDDIDEPGNTEANVIAMGDATKLLHEFACLCTERALERAKVEDRRCWNAIETKRKWLEGKATGEELGAACEAAGDAWSAWSAKDPANIERKARATRGTAWNVLLDARTIIATSVGASGDTKAQIAADAAWVAAKGDARRAAYDAAWDATKAAGVTWDARNADGTVLWNITNTARNANLAADKARDAVWEVAITADSTIDGDAAMEAKDAERDWQERTLSSMAKELLNCK